MKIEIEVPDGLVQDALDENEPLVIATTAGNNQEEDQDEGCVLDQLVIHMTRDPNYALSWLVMLCQGDKVAHGRITFDPLRKGSTCEKGNVFLVTVGNERHDHVFLTRSAAFFAVVRLLLSGTAREEIP